MQEEQDGKLTPQQETKCKEGNVRGVFGYPTTTEELAKKYRISPNKINYILYKYGTMEDYIKSYAENGDTHFESEELLSANVRPYILIDINEETRTRISYSELLQEISTFESSYTCGDEKQSTENKLVRRNVIFYDGQRINEALKELEPRYETVIRMRFGLNDGKKYTLSDVADAIGTKFGETARQIETKAIQRLKYIAKSGKIERTFDAKELEGCDLLPEENERVDLLLDRIYRSNFIFVPDEKYLQESDSIPSSELREIALELQSIRQACLQRRGYKTEDVVIEKLGLNTKTYNSLKRSNINTVLELIDKLQSDNQKGIRQLGPKGKDEIERKLDELARETNIVQKSKEGVWMKKLGGISIDVSSYMELKRANIVSVEQIRAFINLMGAISKINVMKEYEFNKLLQVIISGENDSAITFDSRQIDSMRILGVDGLTGIRKMDVYSFMKLKERLAELAEIGCEEAGSELERLANEEAALRRTEEARHKLVEAAKTELARLEGNLKDQVKS